MLSKIRTGMLEAGPAQNKSTVPRLSQGQAPADLSNYSRHESKGRVGAAILGIEGRFFEPPALNRVRRAGEV